MKFDESDEFHVFRVVSSAPGVYNFMIMIMCIDVKKKNHCSVIIMIPNADCCIGSGIADELSDVIAGVAPELWRSIGLVRQLQWPLHLLFTDDVIARLDKDVLFRH